MGMKEGLGDDPFADDTAESTSESSATNSVKADTGGQSANTDVEQADTRSDVNPTDTASESTGSRTLPYIYKRDAVKDGRSQRPVFLRDYNEDRIPELTDAVEDDLGESVPKTDVLEAALETAIENPEMVAATLRTDRYGYDWE
ncbi:hypothetical protein ACFR9U_14420 [Halorientalis brevis]|uniref:Uncharacterized protein n=1 Tax=Halorientalis brevis TaxID=1126241 RepID=A0ABD6CFJ1_9EURY|nr:hypothetical protein [Halorientalis brevis]